MDPFFSRHWSPLLFFGRKESLFYVFALPGTVGAIKRTLLQRTMFNCFFARVFLGAIVLLQLGSTGAIGLCLLFLYDGKGLFLDTCSLGIRFLLAYFLITYCFLIWLETCFVLS